MRSLSLSSARSQLPYLPGRRIYTPTPTILSVQLCGPSYGKLSMSTSLFLLRSLFSYFYFLPSIASLLLLPASLFSSGSTWVLLLWLFLSRANVLRTRRISSNFSPGSPSLCRVHILQCLRPSSRCLLLSTKGGLGYYLLPSVSYSISRRRPCRANRSFRGT